MKLMKPHGTIVLAVLAFCLLASAQNTGPTGPRTDKVADVTPWAVYRVGGDVQRPKPVYTPDAEYSDAGRRARISGSVVMDIVVTETGTVRYANVVTSLGYGLDEQALATVKTWKFEPATKNGVPVSVRIRVMMTFRISGPGPRHR